MNKQSLDRLKKEGMLFKLKEACRHSLSRARYDLEEATKDDFKKYRASVKAVRKELDDADCLLNEIESL